MAKDNKSPIVTKKHLARVERERMQTRTILIISAIVIAIVLILIGWGIAKTYIIEPSQTVVSIDDSEVSTRQFQAHARFARGQLIDQYAQYYQFMQWFEGDTESQSSIIQTLSQIKYQLEPEYLGQSSIDALIEDVLVRREATKRGIVVEDEEIDKALEQFLGYYPGGTPTAQPQETALPTSTLTSLQETLVAPTATLIPTETLAVDQTSQATEPPAELLATATSTTITDTTPTATSEPSPTPTEYTEKLFNQNMDAYLGYTNISNSELRWLFESELIRQKVYEAITSEVPKESDQVWARQILVADQETANQVLTRLEAGEDFASLANELSADTATNTNGGDMGWFGTGTLEQDLEKITFNLPIGQISDPIQTTKGWVVLQVLGHEIRPIPSSEYQTLIDQVYQDWLTATRAASNVDIRDIYLERVPTEPSIPASMLDLSTQ
jgi:parvulin-like peptidyl-prolyl isomerase